ncbi:MAG TPA: DUF1995 domain-containing protein [Cyanothece sp. UBA12306]|nr:DUF1995 domain-containing protein [Cyanothece sp. UBA12306]
MLAVPNTLEEAVLQAKEATKLALEANIGRIQVELVVPEIALQAQSLALEFTSLFEDPSSLKVIFPDTGAAALARRDWGETPFKVSDLGSRATSVETKISVEDQGFLLVRPSSVEVEVVEKLCDLAGDRPVVLLIPQLENVSVVGIGYAARQLRERFLSTLESVYYFKPLEGAAILRSYPSPWNVYLETETGYELIASEPQKPMGQTLELIFAKATATDGDDKQNNNVYSKKSGFFAGIQQFLRALSQ